MISARLDCAVLAYVGQRRKGHGGIAHLTKVPLRATQRAARGLRRRPERILGLLCPGTDAPSLRDDDWNEVAMIEALRHFHLYGDDAPSDPMEEEDEEEADGGGGKPSWTRTSRAAHRPVAAKPTWKRKQSPLVPT